MLEFPGYLLAPRKTGTSTPDLPRSQRGIIQMARHFQKKKGSRPFFFWKPKSGKARKAPVCSPRFGELQPYGSLKLETKRKLQTFKKCFRGRYRRGGSFISFLQFFRPLSVMQEHMPISTLRLAAREGKVVKHRLSGSAKGSFGKGVFSDLGNLEILEILQNPQTVETKENPTISRDSREFRDSRDSSSQKTPFAMTPFSGPELETLFGGALPGCFQVFLDSFPEVPSYTKCASNHAGATAKNMLRLRQSTLGKPRVELSWDSQQVNPHWKRGLCKGPIIYYRFFLKQSSAPKHVWNQIFKTLSKEEV